MVTGAQPWRQCSNLLQIVLAVGVQHRRLPIPQDCPKPLAELMAECWRLPASRRPCFAEIALRLRQLRTREASSQRAARASVAKGHVAMAFTEKLHAPPIQT